MKSIFLGYSMMLCMVLAIICVLTLSGISIRTNELNHGVEQALYQTVERQKEGTPDMADNNTEMIQNFTQALLIQIESDSSVEVQVLGVDAEKGILSVKVTSHFTHPNGNAGEIMVSRTALLEQYELSKP